MKIDAVTEIIADALEAHRLTTIGGVDYYGTRDIMASKIAGALLHHPCGCEYMLVMQMLCKTHSAEECESETVMERYRADHAVPVVPCAYSSVGDHGFSAKPYDDYEEE